MHLVVSTNLGRSSLKQLTNYNRVRKAAPGRASGSGNQKLYTMCHRVPRSPVHCSTVQGFIMQCQTNMFNVLLINKNKKLKSKQTRRTHEIEICRIIYWIVWYSAATNVQYTVYYKTAQYSGALSHIGFMSIIVWCISRMEGRPVMRHGLRYLLRNFSLKINTGDQQIYNLKLFKFIISPSGLSLCFMCQN